MLVHFRRSFEALQAAQLRSPGLRLAPYLEATTSYVSIVELGMYEMTAQIHARLGEKGLKAGSEEFESRLRRRDGGAAQARGRPALPRGARSGATSASTR